MSLFRKPEDKLMLQFSMDCGAGINSGLSINLPAGTDITRLHDMADKMRRVLDRQRAITELPAFQEKLDMLTAQIETTKKDLIKYDAEAEAETADKGAPKTGTANMLVNLKTNLERLEADVKIGAERVQNIRRRIEAVSDEDIAEVNQLSVAA